jgi:hypothetical protein
MLEAEDAMNEVGRRLEQSLGMHRPGLSVSMAKPPAAPA